jgi:hypothetical protein
MMTMLLLLMTSEPRRPQPTWVDVIEVNHVIRGETLSLTQVIYWRWENDGRLHVVAWRSVEEDYAVQRVDGHWIDYYQGRRVYGRSYRFRCSDYDPEIEDRKVWSVENRWLGDVQILSKVAFGQPT